MPLNSCVFCRAHALISNFMFRWNIKQGISHRFEKDFGHFDYVLLEKIATLEHALTGKLMPGLQLTADFEDTKEKFFYSRESTNIEGEEHLEVLRIPSDLDDDQIILGAASREPVVTEGTDVEERIIAISKMMMPLSKSHRWLAARCGLTRAPFVSRSPTEGEWEFTKTLITQLHCNGYAGSGAKFKKEFLKRWTDACVEMSAGRREDLGIGILTTASCDRFLDSYKSLLDRKASYAEIRSNDEALRKKLRAGSRMRHQPAKAQHDRGCAQCHNRPG